jgi:hypothetical protein
MTTKIDLKLQAVRGKVVKVYELECHGCGDKKRDDQPRELAERAFKAGWRVHYRDEHLYCPECYP